MNADDILSEAAVTDPYEFLGRLRETNPVAWSARYRSWFVTSHALVSQALTDTSFSSDRITPVLEREQLKTDPNLDMVETLKLLNRWLVFRDPPEHTRLRRHVARCFSPRLISQMRETVVETTQVLLDDLRDEAAATGSADLKRTFAFPLPAIVIASMLGVPREDRHLFKGWSDDIAALVFGGLDDRDRHQRAHQGMTHLVEYVQALVAAVRVNPRDDLASALVHNADGEDRLTDEEAVAVCVNLLFGGHETTTNLICNGVLALMGNPAEAELLAREPERADAAIEEILRYDGPAKSVARVAAADIELGGARIGAGDRVFLMLASANRDPAVFEDPDALRVDRPRAAHVSFGAGPHYCLGASLARLEASIAIPAVLQRFPEITVSEPLRWNSVILTRGVEAMPVSL